MFRLGDNPATPAGGQPFAIALLQPFGDVPGVNLHLQQLQILITVTAVASRMADPLHHRRGTLVQPGGDNNPGEVVQHPRQETAIDMSAESIAINLHLGPQIKDVGNFDIFDPVGQ